MKKKEDEMNSLIDKAKAVKGKRKMFEAVSVEEIELALAYINNEVSQAQATQALGLKTGSFQNWVNRRIIRGVRQGLVEIRLTANGRK